MSTLDKSSFTHTVFDQLAVKKRVVTTPSRTIATRNISSIVVDQVVQTAPGWLKVLGVLVLVGGMAAVVNTTGTSSYGYGRSSSPLGGHLITSIGGILLSVATAIHETKHFLVIATNDGLRMFFPGSPDGLSQVRDLLTEKINADDESATFNINFAEGDIQVLNAGSINTDAIIQGKDHKTEITKNVAKGEGARAGTADTTTTTNTTHATNITNSQGVQVGTGNQAFGNTTLVHQVVDYGDYTDTLEKWREFFAQHDEAGTRALRDRIERLEQLLRTGTPEPTQRSTVLQMASELSQVVQGYPAFLHLMQAIVRLAGL